VRAAAALSSPEKAEVENKQVENQTIIGSQGFE
jgi:hypothetical protein